MTNEAIRVFKDNRITLPKKILRKHGLKPGDFIIVEDQGTYIKLIPAMVKPKVNYT